MCCFTSSGCRRGDLICILYYYFSPRSFDVFHGDDAIPTPAPSFSLAKRPKRRRDERGKTLALVASLSEICYLPSGWWRYSIYHILYSKGLYTIWRDKGACVSIPCTGLILEWLNVRPRCPRPTGIGWDLSRSTMVACWFPGRWPADRRISCCQRRRAAWSPVQRFIAIFQIKSKIIKIENCRFFYSRKNWLLPLAMAGKCRWFHCRPRCCPSFCPWPATTWWGPSRWTRRLVPRLNTWCSFLISSL